MPLKVFKRGAVYYARGSVAGQRIYQSTECRKRSDANAWAQRTEAAILKRHALGTSATLTFAEAALDYMNAGGETKHLARIIEYFGPDFLIQDMNNSAVNAAAADLYPDAAPGTINRQLITPIRAVVTLAAEDERTHYRKFRSRKGDNKRTRWLTPAEMDALLFQLNPALQATIAAYAGAGPRVAELMHADVRHFHPETGQIWLDETKNDFPRMLKLPARARDLILQHGIPKNGPLFRKPRKKDQKDGDPYVLIPRQVPFKTAFYNARDKAGLGKDVTPHVLRHTWATWYYAATKDFGGLLDLGGWRVSDMAQRYRKIAPDDLPEQLLAHGWDFTRLGRDLPQPGTAPVQLVAGDQGWQCSWPRPDQRQDPPSLRVVG